METTSEIAPQIEKSSLKPNSLWRRLGRVFFGVESQKPPVNELLNHRSVLEESKTFPKGWFGNSDYADHPKKK